MTDWRREARRARGAVHWEGSRICAGLLSLCDDAGRLVLPPGQSAEEAICAASGLPTALYPVGLAQCAAVGLPALDPGPAKDPFPVARSGTVARAPADAEVEREAELESMTRDQLYTLAQEHAVEGRSSMSKAELVEAILEAEQE